MSETDDNGGEDRVVFKISSSVTGPWRMGDLEVTDDPKWQLPPRPENEPSRGSAVSEEE